MSSTAVLTPPETEFAAKQPEPTVLLVGHPNVGKSVLFSRLTRKYVIASNYSGTSVGVTSGECVIDGQTINVVDTPGINGWAGRSEDERMTLDIVSSATNPIIVQVAEAKNLYRSLLLTTSLAKLGRPMVLVLNMSDEMRFEGIELDRDLLSKSLGIPVVETVAIRAEGLNELKQAITHATLPTIPDFPQSIDANVWIKALVARVQRRVKTHDLDWKIRLGNLMMDPLWGLPFFMVALYLMYKFVGVFGAGFLVDFLENTVFGAWVVPPLSAAFARLVPFEIPQSFLFGEYGLISVGLTYSLAIVLPIVFTFFLAFGIFEDSGYLPRLTILSNRAFKKIGLNGKAILPMVLGLGCGTMATMTTRILATKRERVIATLLLAIGVPCSAQLGVVLALTAAIGSWAVLAVFGTVLLQLVIVGYVSNMIIPGKSSPLVMEIAPIRVPQLKHLVKKTWHRMNWFAKEVVPLFLWATAGLFVFDRLGLLKVAERVLSPIVQGVLGLPGASTTAFIMGFLRRDYGSAGFFNLFHAGQLSVLQTIVSMVVITLFVPCVAHYLMMVKEQGKLKATGITIFVMSYAVFIGWIVRMVGTYVL